MAEKAKYMAACWFCGKQSKLAMIAHRNADGLMVGWLFFCPKHLKEIAGLELTIIPKKPEERQKMRRAAAGG